MFKKDNFLIGLIPGILGPILIGTLYYFYLFGFRSSSEFLKIITNKHMLAPLLSLGCVINLALFFLFIRFDKLSASRGVILSTILYGLLVLILKFS